MKRQPGRPKRETYWSESAKRVWHQLPTDMQSRLVKLHEVMGRHVVVPGLDEILALWDSQSGLNDIQACCAISGVPLRYKGPAEPRLWKLDRDRGWVIGNMVFISRLMYDMLRLYRLPIEHCIEDTVHDVLEIADGLRAKAEHIEGPMDYLTPAAPPAGAEAPEIVPWSEAWIDEQAKRRIIDG